MYYDEDDFFIDLLIGFALVFLFFCILAVI